MLDTAWTKYGEAMAIAGDFDPNREFPLPQGGTANWRPILAPDAEGCFDFAAAQPAASFPVTYAICHVERKGAGDAILKLGGAGLLGSVLSPWLVTRCAEWAPRLGMSALGGEIGPYRLYFACLVPLMVCSLATALALETKLYEYRERHGETALRRAVAFGHHRRH